MGIVQYNEIIKKVNSDSLERSVYIEIEKYCKSKGMEVFQLDYTKYLEMRDYLIKINRNGLLNGFSERNSEVKIEEKDHSNRNQIIKTLLIIGVFVILANVNEVFTFFAYSAAVITAIIGFGTLPVLDKYRSGYDGDYVQRYFRAHEDARINTRAYLNQAWLHSGEIKILNDKINGRK